MDVAPPTPHGSEATQPQPAATQPTGAIPASPFRLAWRRLRKLLLVIPVVALLAGVFGYVGGRAQRRAAQEQAEAVLASDQFAQGLDDLQAGRFTLARQRFEYVIRLNPAFPGAADRLVEALVQIEAPIQGGALIPTPTANLAPVEELFTQARTALAEGDWSRVLDTLLALRAKDAAYRAVEVDGMMYVALRNRGLDRIRNQWQLELGLYDLSRAARFGPLDKEATDWQTSAALYLQANSYIGLRWDLSTDLFLDLCIAGVWDSCDKLAAAVPGYAEDLMGWMDEDPCLVQAEFDSWGWPVDLPIMQPIYDAVARNNEECVRLHPSPTAILTPTETPTPTPEP